tara:strand:- start:291 stop:695 length:405 start_codon:yes stop_codon:yes gene_type:complete
MRKFLFILLLGLFFGSNVYADFNWIKVSTSEGGTTHYVDTSLIKKVKNQSSGWYNTYYYQLTDYVKPTSSGKLSTKAYVEVNCQDYSYRRLKLLFYPEPMGNGKPTIDNSQGDWKSPPEDTVGYKISGFVCNYE